MSAPETFPFARQPSVSRKQIRGRAELGLIAKAENIVLVGNTGRSKISRGSPGVCECPQRGALSCHEVLFVEMNVAKLEIADFGITQTRV